MIAVSSASEVAARCLDENDAVGPFSIRKMDDNGPKIGNYGPGISESSQDGHSYTLEIFGYFPCKNPKSLKRKQSCFRHFFSRVSWFWGRIAVKMNGNDSQYFGVKVCLLDHTWTIYSTGFIHGGFSSQICDRIPGLAKVDRSGI